MTYNVPVLYGASYSVYTRIARLALEEKGIGCELREVEIFGPGGVPAEHLERHPFGRIPVLEHDGFRLYETAAITRYVDEAFPGAPLQPATPAARATMNQTISVLDSYAYRPMIWGVFVQRVSIPKEGGKADEQVVERALSAAAKCVEALQGQLGDRRYLVGDALTLADLHAVPMLMYFAATPEGKQMMAEHPKLARWLAHMLARASVARTKGKYG
jgi:glutathione S-transferase